MKGRQVRSFYAITMTSLYHIFIDQDGKAVVEKIALRKGRGSGISVGGRLKNGSLVGIMASELIVYSDLSGETPPKRPEHVNTTLWGGGTTALVALCLRKREALKCLKDTNPYQLDHHWKKQTKETLDAIGSEHPLFVISQGRNGFRHL